MVNKAVTLRLSVFPIGLMGCVQLVFGLLSLVVFKDGVAAQFVLPASLMLGTAIFLWLITIRADFRKIGYRDALSFATFTWVVAGFLGAVPIKLITGVSLVDSVFESISGLSTTGATILSGLDHMPRSFLLYRQFLQWLGGLGIVIFVVAVLPMLNVGGMKLLKAETPGPIKDEKLSPRIANTAHYLWLVYVLITVFCMLGYWLAGMPLFEAIAHSFTTVSTGGFSTHDASLGYFNSRPIEWIADIFMVLGAISFALHFRYIRSGNLGLYWNDEETRVFLLIILSLSLVLAVHLFQQKFYDDFWASLHQSVFHVISFITSTGYGAAGYTDWTPAAAFLLVFAGYLGGCAGSTAGGNKIIRNIITAKAILLEMKRLIHPRGVFTVRYQNKVVTADVRDSVMAFMSFAAGCSLLITLILVATGLDFWSALTAVAACLNVLGPAFGALGSNFQPVNDMGTWVLSFTMILGRLEYFTVLALLVPAFWKK